MNSYEAIGKTVEEAISQGLAKLGLSIGEVQVDILDEGSKGLFGLFGSKTAKVRLTVKDDVEAGDAPSVFAGSLDSYDFNRREQQAQAKPAPAPAPRAPEQRTPVRESTPAPQKKAPEPRRPAKPEPQNAPLAAAAPAAPAAPRAPRAPRPPREQQPARAAAPAEQRDPATMEGFVQSFLQELTRLMGIQVSVDVKTDEEGNIRANMEGDTLGILIGRRGETLDALQYLTGLHLNRGRDSYTRVTLDSEGYRVKREDALIRLANRMAIRAQKTGRKVAMEPMNPYERRILHGALQNHPGISTHSEGEEPNRHVVITLSQDAPRAEQGEQGEN